MPTRGFSIKPAKVKLLEGGAESNRDWRGATCSSTVLWGPARGARAAAGPSDLAAAGRSLRTAGGPCEPRGRLCAKGTFPHLADFLRPFSSSGVCWKITFGALALLVGVLGVLPFSCSLLTNNTSTFWESKSEQGKGPPTNEGGLWSNEVGSHFSGQKGGI